MRYGAGRASFLQCGANQAASWERSGDRARPRDYPESQSSVVSVKSSRKPSPLSRFCARIESMMAWASSRSAWLVRPLASRRMATEVPSVDHPLLAQLIDPSVVSVVPGDGDRDPSRTGD